MEDDKNVIQSSVMGEVWTSEIKKIKQASNIVVDMYDVEYSDENRKRVYYIKKNENSDDRTIDYDNVDNNSQNYQLKIVIDIESGKLEEVDFGNQIEEPITIEKITEIQKSINVKPSKNKFSRIAPIRDMSAILSLVKEYYSTPDKTDKLNIIGYQDDLIKQINKSGIRFLCFTEGENGRPDVKRKRFNEIVRKAIEEEGVECVNVMYSLEATNKLTMEHSRHSIVAMAYKVDGNDKIIIKTFDSSGASYKKLHENSMGENNEVFIYNQEEGGVTKQTPQGMISNCSYWGEGDLIVVFKKHLQEKGITKEHLTDTKKWDEEVLNKIKTEVKDVLMKTIVKTNSNTQPLPPPLPPIPPIPNTSIQKSGQPSPDSDGEDTPTEETPIIQEHEQIRSILPHSFCNITTSNNPSTSSPQQTQSNTLQAPPKQSTVPLLK